MILKVHYETFLKASTNSLQKAWASDTWDSSFKYFNISDVLHNQISSLKKWHSAPFQWTRYLWCIWPFLLAVSHPNHSICQNNQILLFIYLFIYFYHSVQPDIIILLFSCVNSMWFLRTNTVRKHFFNHIQFCIWSSTAALPEELSTFEHDNEGNKDFLRTGAKFISDRYCCLSLCTQFVPELRYQLKSVQSR